MNRGPTVYETVASALRRKRSLDSMIDLSTHGTTFDSTAEAHPATAPKIPQPWVGGARQVSIVEAMVGVGNHRNETSMNLSTGKFTAALDFSDFGSRRPPGASALLERSQVAGASVLHLLP